MTQTASDTENVQLFTAAASVAHGSKAKVAAGGAVNVIVVKNVATTRTGDNATINAGGSANVTSDSNLDLMALSLSANLTSGKVAAGGTVNVIVDKSVSDTTLGDRVTVEDVEVGSLRVSLYMKNYEFTLPAFSGDIDGSFSNLPNTDDVDNISVRLAYVDKNDTVCFFAESDSAEHRTYCTRNVVGNNVYFEHGLFSGIGYSDNYSIVINEENYPDIIDWDAYTGKELSVKLRLYFDFAAPKYYEFSYSPLRDASLGHIKDNLVAL